MCTVKTLLVDVVSRPMWPNAIVGSLVDFNILHPYGGYVVCPLLNVNAKEVAMFIAQLEKWEDFRALEDMLGYVIGWLRAYDEDPQLCLYRLGKTPVKQLLTTRLLDLKLTDELRHEFYKIVREPTSVASTMTDRLMLMGGTNV